ncbi:type IV pilin-like G/H family protein [Trichocoleus sp. DQ-U1]|uniref:type IV pilin-like G/H family protein n=1 Tax=Trichocoleus sp. DQ-U1 TaxID=2933926 RepID=UPI003298BE8E
MLKCGPVKQSAVEENIESINLAQEAHFSEKKSFANDFNKLGIRLQKQGDDYEYSTRATSSAAFSYGISQSKGLNSYVGAVFVVPATGVKSKAAATREMTTVTILCQANAPGAMKPVEPAYQNGEVACGSNTTEIYRYSP